MSDHTRLFQIKSIFPHKKAIYLGALFFKNIYLQPTLVMKEPLS